MEYHDNQNVRLGGIVELDMPDGREKARVVMLGDTYKHLEFEASFESWVKKDKILKSDSIVIEWLGKNPLGHSDPNYDLVGNYLFTGISADLKPIGRARHE
ncbi:hypothetical protein ACJJIU_05655 [Microbulbifer sp. CnH-101-E]|uniref:hypothetical protein n=1 Tax=unclassified Microbulbifer TaxID=2619833 RepID=UPI0040398AD9